MTRVLLLALLLPPSAADEPIAGIGPAGPVVRLHTGFRFTEGPAADEAGNLYFSDIPHNRIHKVDLQGRLSTFLEDTQGINGLMFDGRGRLVACQGGAGRLVAIDPATRRIEVLADSLDGAPLGKPNDLVVDRHGGVYFTDRDRSVYYLGADGRVSRAIGDLPLPNGVLLSPDESTLYVLPSGTPDVLAYPVEGPGRVGSGRVLCRLEQAPTGRPRGGDGLTVDTEGNLYLAQPALGALQVVAPDGRTLGFIRLPEGPANCAFGGPDRKTLYVTARTSLYAIPMHATGHRFAGRPPNLIVIFADDLGYADLGCYGARGYATPHLDRMAAEGMRFTSFYVAQAVCTASRAALLTGCYPNRVGLLSALGPGARTGLHPDEVTIPKVLKERGYATAVYGKWHLGDHREFLPTRRGFDDYFGIPYSNDMWPFHPENPDRYPPLPLLEGDNVVETNPDQTRLTGAFTDRAVKFIEAHRDRPFFLYVPHPMPHVPLFASEAFRGTTERGLYGDVVAEIDASVGRILDAVRRTGLDERTLVVFLSDNGPWLSYGDHAGSAAPFREGKGTTFEGGVRVPAIFRWPGKIPAGRTCAEMALAMDLLPTFARLAGAALPEDRPIDGKDLWPLLSGAETRTPHEVFYYYWGRELQAIRSGPWKLHFPHAYRSLEGPGGRDGRPARYVQRRIELSLFNLDDDPGETKNVAADHPEVVRDLENRAERAREELGDALTRRPGRNVRAAGTVDR